MPASLQNLNRPADEGVPSQFWQKNLTKDKYAAERDGNTGF